jgi:hypothetical protein
MNSVISEAESILSRVDGTSVSFVEATGWRWLGGWRPRDRCRRPQLGAHSGSTRDDSDAAKGPQNPVPPTKASSSGSPSSRTFLVQSCVADQAEPVSPISRSHVTRQPEPMCHAPGGPKHRYRAGGRIRTVDLPITSRLRYRAAPRRRWGESTPGGTTDRSRPARRSRTRSRGSTPARSPRTRTLR